MTSFDRNTKSFISRAAIVLQKLAAKFAICYLFKHQHMVYMQVCFVHIRKLNKIPWFSDFLLIDMGSQHYTFYAMLGSMTL